MVTAAGNGGGFMLVVWTDVQNPKSILLKARRFSTNNPSVDLAAGADVDGGGQGANKVLLVAKKTKLSPGGTQMKEKTSQAEGNFIVKHESEISEAIRTSQASAKAAANAVQRAASKKVLGQKTRNQSRAAAPTLGAPTLSSTLARPVNAEVIGSSGSRIGATSAVRPAAQGSFGIQTANGSARSARISSIRRPVLVQQSAPRNNVVRAPASMGITQSNAGMVRGGTLTLAGSRPAASMVTSQAARNALLTTARSYSGSRRVGMKRAAPNIRNSPTGTLAQRSSAFNYGIGSRSGNGSRGMTGMRATIQRPATQAVATANTTSRSPVTQANQTVGGSFRRTVGTGQIRFTENRNSANQGAARSQQMRNVPVPSTVTLQNGRMNLRHNSRPGTRYVVQMSNDRNNWNAVGRPHVGTGRTMTVPFESNGQRFIRVVPRD